MKWIGGFEGADHVNGSGAGLSMAKDSGHLSRLDGDYRRLRRLGFFAVRESLGWRTCESARKFDFTSLHARMRAAERHGLETLARSCCRRAPRVTPPPKRNWSLKRAPQKKHRES